MQLLKQRVSHGCHQACTVRQTCIVRHTTSWLPGSRTHCVGVDSPACTAPSKGQWVGHCAGGQVCGPVLADVAQQQVVGLTHTLRRAVQHNLLARLVGRRGSCKTHQANGSRGAKAGSNRRQKDWHTSCTTQLLYWW